MRSELPALAIAVSAFAVALRAAVYARRARRDAERARDSYLRALGELLDDSEDHPPPYPGAWGD